MLPYFICPFFFQVSKFQEREDNVCLFTMALERSFAATGNTMFPINICWMINIFSVFSIFTMLYFHIVVQSSPLSNSIIFSSTPKRNPLPICCHLPFSSPMATDSHKSMSLLKNKHSLLNTWIWWAINLACPHQLVKDIRNKMFSTAETIETWVDLLVKNIYIITYIFGDAEIWRLKPYQE